MRSDQKKKKKKNVTGVAPSSVGNFPRGGKMI